MGEVIKVGMADLKVCKYPDSLTTLGLGSCVGVALYDKATKVTGLAHIMLPDSSAIKNITPKYIGAINLHQLFLRFSISSSLHHQDTLTQFLQQES